MKDRKKGLGLFTWGSRKARAQAGKPAPGELEERQAVDQIVGQESVTQRAIRPASPDPVNYPGNENRLKKAYEAPCFFSCVPYEFQPVDKYAALTIIVLP